MISERNASSRRGSNRRTILKGGAIAGLSAMVGIDRSAHAFAVPSPLDQPDFFPICVWLQSPRNAEAYKKAGINTYVGLWRGPNEEQLAELEKAGMYAICHQNATGLKWKDKPTILAWMHDDEPDNAQARPGGKGYGPPVLPSVVQEGYAKIKEKDPSRPVFLNLGQGVAYDNYIGRGVRRNKPEDYPEYVKGADIVSFDIYPACHDNEEVAGKLWFVADGVARLKKWAGPVRKVWNCIETTQISHKSNKATPLQVRAEVWMSLVRGSQGIVYFAHQFVPNFVEAGFLRVPDMLEEITRTNLQIRKLAKVLKSPTIEGRVEVKAENPAAVVECMVKEDAGALYVFAVNLRGEKSQATFRISKSEQFEEASVIDENRSVRIVDGTISDSFDPWGVHHYRIEKGS
ncbi:hypothetical protein GC170_02065 [bacterium]|nr:hypothetical protein [bacterium]